MPKKIDYLADKNTICAICGGGSIFNGKTVSFSDCKPCAIFRCKSCGHRQIIRDSQKTTIKVISMTMRGLSTKAHWVFDRLPVDIKARNSIRVLDIGCWTGDILLGLPASWDKTGIEMNVRAAEIARKRGLNVIVGSFDTVPLTRSYELVLLLDVLEHLEEPIRMLEIIANLLAPSGYLVALTGNADSLGAHCYKGKWYYANYPEHTSLFTPESAELGVNHVGLKMRDIIFVKHSTSSIVLTFKKLITRLFRKRDCTDDAYGKINHFRDAVPLAFSRIFRGKDHMLLTAQKET